MRNKEEKDCTLSIRLTTSDKLRYLDFCSHLGLTQAQAFRLLLDHAEQAATDRHLAALLDEKNKQIFDLTQALKKLPEKKIREEVRMQIAHYMTFFKNGLLKYLHLLFPANSGLQKLKPVPYHDFKETYPKGVPFPENEGFAPIHLKMLVRGKGIYPAIFIIGQTDDNTLIRLRYYPRASFLGFSPINSSFAYEGSRWYVGYRRANDDAMDLVTAFPLDRSVQQSDTPPAVQNTHPALDDIIRNVQQRLR